MQTALIKGALKNKISTAVHQICVGHKALISGTMDLKNLISAAPRLQKSSGRLESEASRGIACRLFQQVFWDGKAAENRADLVALSACLCFKGLVRRMLRWKVHDEYFMSASLATLNFDRLWRPRAAKNRGKAE